MKTPQERFEEKFTKVDGCWEWTAGIFQTGYGAFGFAERVQYAHRVSYQFYIGEIPAGLCVLHKCDNPSCVNPSHLFLGTKADNAHDRDNKGRGNAPHGEKCGRAKLTAEQVLAIKAKHTKGAQFIDLAKEFGMTRQQISNIVNGRQWKNA